MGKKIEIAKLDSMFSKIVKKRDRYRCMLCGQRFTENFPEGLECSHYWRRSNKTTRFDLRNADSLCCLCHHLHEGKKKGFYRDWKIKQLGQEGFDDLERLARSVGRFGEVEKMEILTWLKEKLSD